MSETIDLPIAEAMSAHDLQAHHKALQTRLGMQAYVSIHAGSTFERSAVISMYPDGLMDSGTHHSAKGSTWAEALNAAYAWVETHAVVRRDAITRKMALAIIELTDEHGECTASMLERKKFSREYIMEFHEAACQRASEMCANSPFSVEF